VWKYTTDIFATHTARNRTRGDCTQQQAKNSVLVEMGEDDEDAEHDPTLMNSLSARNWREIAFYAILPFSLGLCEAYVSPPQDLVSLNKYNTVKFC
jgi:hypothetical protein